MAAYAATAAGAQDREWQYVDLFFRNQRDGTFKNISKLVGPAIQTLQVSRGVAVGDLFNDGRIEVEGRHDGRSGAREARPIRVAGCSPPQVQSGPFTVPSSSIR